MSKERDWGKLFKIVRDSDPKILKETLEQQAEVVYAALTDPEVAGFIIFLLGKEKDDNTVSLDLPPWFGFPRKDINRFEPLSLSLKPDGNVRLLGSFSTFTFRKSEADAYRDFNALIEEYPHNRVVKGKDKSRYGFQRWLFYGTRIVEKDDFVEAYQDQAHKIATEFGALINRALVQLDKGAGIEIKEGKEEDVQKVLDRVKRVKTALES